MAYSIIGIKNHKSMASVAQVGHHNERTRETRNADPARTPFNERLLGSGDLRADVQARLDAAGITKVRANGIRAVEHFISASPEWFQEAPPTQRREWADRTLTWLKGRYGENLVAVNLHVDETTPNIHAIVVPITPDGQLCHKKLFGDPSKLRGMHTDYNRTVRDLGLERGIMGSKAKHQDIRAWYAQMKNPTREAWDLARTMTFAPPTDGTPLEEHLARTIAPALGAERTRAQYWQQRAEQAEAQLRGERTQRRAHEMTREEYGQLVNRVRDTDLTEVIQALGAQRDRTDTHKWHINGKEINIRGQKYYDFHAPATDPLARRGGAIDLIQYATGWDFKTTVDYLNYRHYGGHALATPTREQAPYVQNTSAPERQQLPPEARDRWPEVRRYLVDERHIPAAFVDKAHDRSDIYATTYGRYTNAVFVRRDEHGQAVSAFVRGTAGDFRQSTKREGYFSLDFGTPNTLEKPTLILVESPIDALSYAALHRDGLRYGRVLSTDGRGPLPTAQIDRTLAEGGKVRAAFDNDGPGGGGEKLWGAVQERYPQQTHGEYTPIMRELPTAKDWNEDLQRGSRHTRSKGKSGAEIEH